MPKRHIHSNQGDRQIKRIARSVDSQLRAQFGLTLDPNISNPCPVPIELVRAYLHEVADSAGTTQELEGKRA